VNSVNQGRAKGRQSETFRKKIAEAGMPEEAQKEAERELDRLSKLLLPPLNTVSSALFGLDDDLAVVETHRG